MKKAYLVKVSFITRVIADENLENEKNWKDLVDKAQGNVYQKIAHGEFEENIEDVTDDTECPYEG